jgi:hypothetical protein
MIHALTRRAALSGWLCILAIPAAAFAQPDPIGQARGVVVDSAGHPVESVEISALTVGRFARTDSAGRFSIGGLIAGRNQLLVRRLGWRAVDTMVAIDPRAPLDLRVVLARLPQNLQAVHVVSQDECPTRTLEGFDCRRRAGFGAFRDSAEIAALKPVCAADIVYGMEGLRRVPGIPCPRFVPTTGWRCIRTLVDGRLMTGANGPPALMSDYVGVEFYADYKTAPEWYKQFAFAQSTIPVPTHQEQSGRAMIYRQPALPGRSCSLLVYWTHFAARFDPSLDQSAATTRIMQARRDSFNMSRMDSTHAKPDSTVQKKP